MLLQSELLLHFLVDDVGDVSIVSCTQAGLEVTNKLNLGDELIVEIAFFLVDAV